MSVKETEPAWQGWCDLLKRLADTIEREEHQSSSYGHEERALARLKKRYEAERKALENLASNDVAIYRGDRELERTDAEIQVLVQSVCGNSSGYEHKHRHQFLARGLERGVSALGWRLQVPAPPAISPTQTSNMTPANFQRLQVYDRMEEAFWIELKEERSSQINDTGRLIWSFVHHSGLCSKKLLSHLADAIRNGVGVRNGVVWLDLAEVERDRVDSTPNRRRVFPAPITQMLLRRWYERWGGEWPLEEGSGRLHAPVKLMNRYHRQLSECAGLENRQAQAPLMIAAAHFSTVLPNFLVHFLRTHSLGAPLPVADWVRLLTGQRLKASHQVLEQDSEQAPDVDVGKLARSAVAADLYGTFSDLKLVFTKDGVTKDKRSDLLNSFHLRSDLHPIIQMMAAWASKLHHFGGVAKRQLSPNSIVRYLDHIAPLMNYPSELLNPLESDEDEWQSIYDDIVANTHGRIAERGSRLAEFHRFLVHAYNVPAVDIGGWSAQRQVDARLITPRESKRVRERLRASAKSRIAADRHELLFILGYRCGLRRGEAISRLLVDFPGLQDAESPELIVRPNKNANIKSSSSVRRLPLNILLLPDELSLLRRVHRLACNDPTHRRDQPLMGEWCSGLSQADRHQFFESVTGTLQEVTGDQNFRYHNLRHSFVTLNLLRLIEAQPGEHIPDNWVRDDEGNPLLPGLDGEPLWRQAGLKDSSKSIWLLAQWVGHVSPNVTLEAYSHLLDWLTRSYLWQRQNPTLTRADQCALLGKTEHALQKWRSRNGIKGDDAASIANQDTQSWPRSACKDSQLEAHEIQPLPERSDAQAGVDAPFELMDVYRLLFDSHTVITTESGVHPRGLDAAAIRQGIDIKTAQQWQKNAEILMAHRSQPVNGFFEPAPQSSVQLSRETPDVLRPINEKDVSKRLPELDDFVTAPNTPTTMRYAKSYYECLRQWVIEDPDSAQAAMHVTLQHSQRSHAAIRIRGRDDQRQFYRLLCQIGEKARTTIAVKLAPDADRDSARWFWAEFFEVNERDLRIQRITGGSRGEKYGHCQIEVTPPEDLNVNQNLFWMVLRFTVMSALVAYGDLTDG